MTGRWLWTRITVALLGGGLNLAMIALVTVYAFTIADGRIAFDGGRIGPQVRDLLWFALLCGLVAFATVEIMKRIFDLRGLYQYRQTRIWLRRRAEEHRQLQEPPDASSHEVAEPTSRRADAFEELLEAMGYVRKAQSRPARLLEQLEELRIFNLPTEQLAAQISAAADAMLVERGKRTEFLAALTGLSPTAITSLSGKEAPENLEYQLAQRIRAGVDRLQISLAERWRGYVQGAAVWIAGASGVVLARLLPPGSGSEARYVLAALLIGGILAWVTRDLTATLERSRR